MNELSVSKAAVATAIVFVGVISGAVLAGDKNNTLAVARLVREKGLATIDLNHYTGVLLMQGMAELAIASGDENDMRIARETLLPYATGEATMGGNFVSYRCGGNGAALLLLNGKLSEGRDRIMDAARVTSMKCPRSEEGIILSKSCRKSKNVFIDTAFAVTPFMLWSGLTVKPDDSEDTNAFRRKCIDDAWNQTIELHRILRSPDTGLYHQGRGFQGQGVISTDHWSRGNGWAAMSWAALIRSLPQDDPRRPEAEKLFRQFMKAVVKYQGHDGMWHQEMTRQDRLSYPETSGTGLLLYAMGVGIEGGVLDESYRVPFERGLRSYMKYIADDGSVSHTSCPSLCPGDGTPEAYFRHEWVKNDPHAFGPVLLALSQSHRIGYVRIVPED